MLLKKEEKNYLKWLKHNSPRTQKSQILFYNQKKFYIIRFIYIKIIRNIFILYYLMKKNIEKIINKSNNNFYLIINRKIILFIFLFKFILKKF